MKSNIFKLLTFLFMGIFTIQAQNTDPHGSNESAITGMVSSERKTHKSFKEETATPLKIWTKDEIDVKATVDKFLIVAGNYNLKSMAEMMAKNANLAITSLKDGKWTTKTLSMDNYFIEAKSKTHRPYYEPQTNYSIHVNDGHLAIVKANGLLHSYGIPIKINRNYFTLIKENGVWRFINISFTNTSISTDKQTYDSLAFAKGYAQAWCSQKPEYVAMFYSEDGSLNINNGTPAIGRTAITKNAKAFMDAFPDDMIVAFDSLVKTEKGVEFHWTLTGTNTGPNGTGKKVNISGFELWKLNENGLIKESKGTFNAEEYNRQIKYGVEE